MSDPDDGTRPEQHEPAGAADRRAPAPVAVPPWPVAPARTSPWVWVSLAMSGVAVGLVLLSFVVPMLLFGVLGPALGGEEDWSDDLGDEYYVSQSTVVRAAASPCRDVSAVAERVRLFDGADAGSVDLRDLATALRGVAEAVRDADPDAQSRAWADDWALLAERTDAAAQDLAAGRDLSFSVDDDGHDVVERMGWGGPASCQPPAVIRVLDPSSRGESALQGGPF